MLIATVLTILALGQFILGLLLWVEGRRTKRLDQRLFAAIAFLLVGWTISVGLLTGVDTSDAGYRITFYTFINSLAFVLSVAIMLAVYTFSLYYPLKRTLVWRQKVLIVAGVAVMLCSLLPSVSGHFITDYPILIYTYGSFSFIIAVYALLVIVSIFFEEGSIMRRSQDTKLHRQAKTLLVGFSLTITHAVVFVVLLPGLFGQKPIFYALGYVAPYYLLLFTGYGLLRQGLFDIRAIAARSLAYLFSVSITSIVYVLSAVLLSNLLLSTPLKNSTLVTLAIVTLVVAAFFHPLKTYFNRITNRFFYRDYYDPQDVLDRLSSLLVGTVDVEQILLQTKNILYGSLKPTTVQFLLFADKDNRKDSKLLLQLLVESTDNLISGEGSQSARTQLGTELRRHEAAIAIRLRTAHEDLGFLLLGFRRSGVLYSDADRRLLGVLADELAVGLQNALRFEEIERFNETLQQKIETATRKLRQTNDKLRTLDQTKDDFISMASHQLRTPLTSVKGYVSMVLDGDVGNITPVQRKLLNQAFISSQRMVYLISDLLNVSRLRTGKFMIEPVPTNLAHIVHDEVSQLLETAKGRGLELIYHKPEHFPQLMLDETKTRQVVMNFIDNAIYYTPTGGHITVTLTEKPETIELTVVDDGIGVPRAEQHHLFSKFYRAHNAKRARPDGTGLGLFMAKKVIVAQGGAIIFKSHEGKGSTFGFTFAKAPLLPPAKDTKKDLK